MAQFLEMKYLGDGETAGFGFKVEPPNVDTVKTQGAWARCRYSITSGALDITAVESELFGVFYRLDSSSTTSIAAYVFIGNGVWGVKINSDVVYTSSFAPDIANGRPSDFVFFVGQSGSSNHWFVKTWINDGQTDYRMLYRPHIAISGSSPDTASYLDYITFNWGSDQDLQDTTTRLRLFEWEVIPVSSSANPYGITHTNFGAGPLDPGGFVSYPRTAEVSTVPTTISSLRQYGDNFSTYASQSEFTESVGIDGGLNARDQVSPTVTNQNYLGYNTEYGGFVDFGLDMFPTPGTYWTMTPSKRSLFWRYIASSSNSSGPTSPFGGQAIWQLVDKNGYRISPKFLVGFISSSWNTQSIVGEPELGLYEFTTSLSQSDWTSPVSPGQLQLWNTFPGTPSPVTYATMSVRNLANATFWVGVSSASAYGVNQQGTNYGFYPVAPAGELDVSIFETD